jgi:hypothetical protein
LKAADAAAEGGEGGEKASANVPRPVVLEAAAAIRVVALSFMTVLGE